MILVVGVWSKPTSDDGKRAEGFQLCMGMSR
jgi:hypothetical protein